MKYRVVCQTDIDYLARKERYKDLLREAESNRLIQTIQPKQPVLRSRAAKWLTELGARRPRRPPQGVAG
jgi:hypothetical protein